MLSYSDAFYRLYNALKALYDTREASAIADQYLGYLTGTDKLTRIVLKDVPLTPAMEAQWYEATDMLAAGTPLQYITGTVWFMGHMFSVNKHVLIPRPETEELVTWVIDDNKERKNIIIADIGTGSGCIGISLKLALQRSVVSCYDISRDALTMTEKNARTLNTGVMLYKVDVLDRAQWMDIGVYDIIVSNPPYIPEEEKKNMHSNVKDHEPSIALFVPDEDPLIFYRAIAELGKLHLNKNGVIYCELHTSHAEQTGELFREMGYRTEVRADMHGNLRMLKAEVK